MPLSKYDAQFGGKGGAAKAMHAMTEHYGAEKGRQVFYATKNKRKSGDRRDHLIRKFVSKHRRH